MKTITVGYLNEKEDMTLFTFVLTACFALLHQVFAFVILKNKNQGGL